MSSFDWNGDRKKDAADDFIDYHIINDSSGNDNGHPEDHSGQKIMQDFEEQYVI